MGARPHHHHIASKLEDVHLRLAYRHGRWPAAWPPSFDAVMADPARAACIRGYAIAMGVQLARGGIHTDRAPAHTLPKLEAPSTPTAPPAPINHRPHHTAALRPAWMTRPAVGTHDAKRAAANDRED
jgi:hypothetical protein